MWCELFSVPPTGTSRDNRNWRTKSAVNVTLYYKFLHISIFLTLCDPANSNLLVTLLSNYFVCKFLAMFRTILETLINICTYTLY